MKHLIFGAIVTLSITGGAPVMAQDAQTLADIRQETSVLYVEITKLKRELSTTGSPNTASAGGSTLARLDSLESSLAQLTGKIEQLEFRIDGVTKDGTRQLEDLNFRICELEQGCDIGDLPSLAPLGGSAAAATPAPTPAAATAVPSTPTSSAGASGGQLAEAEQFDFDTAKAAYDKGDYEEAASAFSVFSQIYTGGVLTSEAHFLRGDSFSKLGKTEEAARAYLESFNVASEGPRAPSALLRLGTSMASLGHVSEGCVMLAEVDTRFSGTAQAAEALSERQNLSCQ
jgi:tol-pal system protein YbgF